MLVPKPFGTTIENITNIKKMFEYFRKELVRFVAGTESHGPEK